MRAAAAAAVMVVVSSLPLAASAIPNDSKFSRVDTVAQKDTLHGTGFPKDDTTISKFSWISSSGEIQMDFETVELSCLTAPILYRMFLFFYLCYWRCYCYCYYSRSQYHSQFYF